MKRTAFRTCPICEAGCGLALELEGERVVRVHGDAADLMSAGYLCPKGAQLAELEDDPDRITSPRIRRDGQLVPASWEEAFAVIEEQLQRVIRTTGRESLSIYLGNAIAHSLSGLMYVRPLVKALGSKQIFSSSSVDSHPKFVSSGLLFGDAYTMAVPDIDRTDLLVVIGANPMASNGSLWTVPNFPDRLRKLKARGGQLVVLDPRRTATAREADLHLAIRPGTDAFLLAAMLTQLHQDGLLQPSANAQGHEALIAAVAGFTPERVAPSCGLDAEAIRQLARRIARTPRACVYGRMGASTVRFGTLTNFLIDALNVLTGHIDQPGTLMFPQPAAYAGRPPPFRTGRWRSRVRGLPEVIGELPAATMIEEIATAGEGQIKAMVIIGGNPVLSSPEGDKLAPLLAGLDLLVCIDPHVNATTRLAHVVLPPLPSIHRSHYDVFFSGRAVRNYANYSPAVLPKPTGACDEWEILLTLAGLAQGRSMPVDVQALDEAMVESTVTRMVQDPEARIAVREPAAVQAALAGRVGPERLLDLALRAGPYGEGFGGDPAGLTLAALETNPHGIDLGPLQPRLPAVLCTESGKIELAPQVVLQDLPRLEAALAEAPTHSFLLVGRRHLRTNNSWTHNVVKLSRERGRSLCTLQIHPDDARRLALESGALAQVTSDTGSVQVRVQVTADIRPGVVCLPHGFGHDLPGVELRVARATPGVNSNVLNNHDALDGPSSNAVLNAIPVNVRAVAPVAPA